MKSRKKTTEDPGFFELTKEELAETWARALDELIEEAGGAGHLAVMLNIPCAYVRQWVHRGKISLKHAKIVEEHPRLGQVFTAERLRPELGAPAVRKRRGLDDD